MWLIFFWCNSSSRKLSHLVHLALQGHSAVFDPLFLHHLVVEHALQLLQSPSARLKPHFGRIQGLGGRKEGGAVDRFERDAVTETIDREKNIPIGPTGRSFSKKESGAHTK